MFVCATTAKRRHGILVISERDRYYCVQTQKTKLTCIITQPLERVRALVSYVLGCGVYTSSCWCDVCVRDDDVMGWLPDDRHIRSNTLLADNIISLVYSCIAPGGEKPRNVLQKYAPAT